AGALLAKKDVAVGGGVVFGGQRARQRLDRRRRPELVERGDERGGFLLVAGHALHAGAVARRGRVAGGLHQIALGLEVVGALGGRALHPGSVEHLHHDLVVGAGGLRAVLLGLGGLGGRRRLGDGGGAVGVGGR